MINLVLLLLITDIPADKAAHTGVSWAINHVGYSLCMAQVNDKKTCLATSVIGTAIIGVSKELNDDSFDTKDLAADALGIGLSSLTITLTW